MNPQCDEVCVNSMAINIDALTDAWATVIMTADIGPNHHGNIHCKVNTGASGNVMPLHIFAKLSPRCLTKDGKPTRLHLCETRLVVYNGSNIPQFRALDTAIEWTPKGYQH